MFLTLATLAAAGIVHHDAMAQADNYPNRPIRMIIPFTAGGPADIVARIFADRISTELGQRVIPDNRPGANSVIGTQLGVKSEPDGYTIITAAGATVTAPMFLKDKPYDVEKDLLPVAFVGGTPNVLIVPGKSSVKTLQDLVAQSKSTPGGINYGSGGNGSLGQMSAVMLVSQLKMNATHVPYKGNAQAVQDVVAGQIQFAFPSPLETAELAKAGDLRILAVTSADRVSTMPDVPTMKELGFPQIDPSIWSGWFVPVNTPAPIVARLSKAFATAAADPAVQEKLKPYSFQIKVLLGPEFGKFVQQEGARWKKVIEENNIKGD